LAVCQEVFQNFFENFCGEGNDINFYGTHRLCLSPLDTNIISYTQEKVNSFCEFNCKQSVNGARALLVYPNNRQKKKAVVQTASLLLVVKTLNDRTHHLRVAVVHYLTSKLIDDIASHRHTIVDATECPRFGVRQLFKGCDLFAIQQNPIVKNIKLNHIDYLPFLDYALIIPHFALFVKWLFESFENFFENSFIGFLVKIGNAVIVA
jgi:hypothetical protein